MCWAIMVTWLSVSEKCRTQGEPYPPRRDVAQRRLFSGLPNETYTGPALEFKASNHRRVILPSASTYREFHPNWAPRPVFSWGLSPGNSALSRRNPPTHPQKQKQKGARASRSGTRKVWSRVFAFLFLRLFQVLSSCSRRLEISVFLEACQSAGRNKQKRGGEECPVSLGWL